MSWLMPEWQKTVVYIGQSQNTIRGVEKNQVGTGVLLSISQIGFVATCRHVVLDNNNKFRNSLHVSYASKVVSGAERAISDINGNTYGKWFFHSNPDVDIALGAIGTDPQSDDIKFITEEHFLQYQHIEAGDDVFLIGFQPGLPNIMKPIVRSGIVSRIEEKQNKFYIDASVFPGNSGSPVLLKPTPIRREQGGIALGSTHLGKFIGISSGYLPYQDVAISSQTLRPRVIFEENTGLSLVWSVDALNEIIRGKDFQDFLNEVKVTSPRGEQ